MIHRLFLVVVNYLTDKESVFGTSLQMCVCVCVLFSCIFIYVSIACNSKTYAVGCKLHSLNMSDEMVMLSIKYKRTDLLRFPLK